MIVKGLYGRLSKWPPGTAGRLVEEEADLNDLSDEVFVQVGFLAGPCIGNKKCPTFPKGIQPVY